MPVAMLAEPPFVILSVEDRLLRLAAGEWVRYSVAAGLGAYTAVVVDDAVLERTPTLDDDTATEVVDEPFAVTATESAAVLRAVYRRLGQLGWRWYFPGPLGEVFRRGHPAPEASGQGVPHRVLIDRSDRVGSPTWLSEIRQLVDWLGKQGFTTLALENSPSPEAVAQLTPELTRRGLAFEVGGDLVGRLLASARPLAGHEARHNLGYHRPPRIEVADPEALSGMATAARSYLAGYGGASAVRLTEPADAPVDLTADRSMPVPGQRLRAVVEGCVAGLAGAARLAVWRPDSKARRGFSAPAGARLVLSTEPRSFHLNLTSGGDSRHAEMIQTITEAAHRPGGFEVCLPYADLHSLRALLGPLPRRIQADVKLFADIGLERVSILTGGLASAWAYPLNLYVFARCLAWPELDLDALLADWCEGLYPPVSAEMLDYLGSYEEAMQPVWMLREVVRSGFGTKRATAISDRHRQRLNQAISTLRKLADRVSELAEGVTDPLVAARLEREATACRLSQLQADVWMLRLMSLVGHPSVALLAIGRELETQIRQTLDRIPASTCGSLHRDYLSILGQANHTKPEPEPRYVASDVV